MLSSTLHCLWLFGLRGAGAVRAASPARFRLWGRAAKEEEATEEQATAAAMVQVRTVIPRSMPSVPPYGRRPHVPHEETGQCPVVVCRCTHTAN